jgi:hypothetical protein
MSRLTINLTDQQHQTLRASAVLQGKTIKQYAIERLFPGDPGADRAWQELKALLTARVEDALAGNVSTKTVSEIFDEELADEARDA